MSRSDTGVEEIPENMCVKVDHKDLSVSQKWSSR